MLDTPLQRRENSQLVAFLKAHSGRRTLHGDQCGRHKPIREMLRGEIRDTLMDHNLRPYSRQHIFNECRRLEIETRGRKGPRRVRTMPEKLAQGRARWRRWYAEIRKDPERLEDYRQKEREKHRRRASDEGQQDESA